MSILGLTATATLKVIDDIRQILKIPHCILFRAPFNRKNLFYEVLHKSDIGKDAFSDLVRCIQHRFDQQSGRTFNNLFAMNSHKYSIGIVYCLSQKDAEDVCFELQKHSKRRLMPKNETFCESPVDIKAGCYHAGLTALARTKVHEKWLENQVHVICATIAFGLFD